MITCPRRCWLVVYHDYFPLGAVYTYLSSGAGRTQREGTFPVLTCGSIHWASGRIDSIEVNIHNPLYVHIQSSIKCLDITTARGSMICRLLDQLPVNVLQG